MAELQSDAVARRKVDVPRMENRVPIESERDLTSDHGIYPSLTALLSSEDPSRLMEVRRSLRSVLSGFALMVISAIGVYLINYRYPVVNMGLGLIDGISTRWLALIPLGILLEIVRRYNDDLYIFGEETVTHFEGRLSLNYSVPAIKYAHIRAIMVRQDLMGRLFDYGDVSLGTAAQEGDELYMSGVRSPYQLGQLIEEFQFHNRRRLRANQKKVPHEPPAAVGA